ncbi:MAG: succinate dehydrogenase, cytochrome b556 subunit [Hyphomicrobium sp.]
MVTSILHRITGAALYVGSLLLAWWLFAAATGPDYFAFVNGLFASPLGMLVLVGFSWALIHHAVGGLRHFVWDTGSGLDIASVNLLSWARSCSRCCSPRRCGPISQSSGDGCRHGNDNAAEARARPRLGA